MAVFEIKVHWGINRVYVRNGNKHGGSMRGIKVQKSHVKSSILKKTGGVCAVCGRPLVQSKVTIDHYIPKYHGGTDDERNLLPLCKSCNKSKGSRMVQAKEHYPFLEAGYCSESDEYRIEWEKRGEQDVCQ